LQELHSSFKQHYQQLQQQCQEYQKKLGEEIANRKQLEQHGEQRVADLKRAIESKQKELEQMQQKMVLPIDTDILRMKIHKDIEGRHRHELDMKQ